MNYDLAKELKEAGFPGITMPDREECLIDGEPGYHTPLAIYPTLSELIEACQKFGIEGFSRAIKITISGQTSWWSMVTTLEDENLIPVQSASTPEEAVARLWLALNPKKE